MDNEESWDNKATNNERNSLTNKMRENPWIVSTLVFGVLSLILIFMSFSGGITGNVISANDAGEKLNDFANAQGVDLIVNSVSEENGLYKINCEIDGKATSLYVTKDGKNLVSGLIPLSLTTDSESTSSQTQNVPKSDKPVVELFVMTHCPYGTQAEKGFLPAIVAFGDKIDASVKFVHYFLHDPEYDETPVQICIREEQGDKYNTYLKEFLVEGDTEASLIKAGIDKTKLEDCVTNRYEDYYVTDSELSESYGVKGSPTLVVNGQIVNSGRSADAYLNTICSAFTEGNVPSECDTLELDTATPSAGFGYGQTSSVATAQC
jgi:hypothetical protein